MMLQYLKRKHIDAAKWNRCIEEAHNSLVYATLSYLDSMAGTWDALVLNDYDAVMPLPFRSKYGIRYVAMPAFVQQLGIFSKDHLAKETSEAFLQKAKQLFHFADYHFNHASSLPGLESRNNFILHLQPGYDQLRAGYKPDLVKNLSRAQKFQMQYGATGDYAKAIALYRSLYAVRQPSVRPADYLHFEKLCAGQKVVVREVYEGDALLACALCMQDNKRLYLLMSATTDAGRTREANHWLLDRIIHEFSGSPLVFDFEGSDVPGIAHFYRNFGTVNQPYFYVRWNHLPWPIRYLKPLSSPGGEINTV